MVVVIMAFAPAQERQEEQAALQVSWKPGFPRGVDLAKTIPAIEGRTEKYAKPLIVKTGDAKQAEKVAIELTSRHPDKYLTSVTKAGDVQVLNTEAVIDEIKQRMHDRGHATTVALGSAQGAFGIARRLKEAGIAATVMKGNFVHAVDADAFADRITATMGKLASRASNAEAASREEARAVAKAINERSNGAKFASVDGTKIDVVNVETAATYMYRCRTSGYGTLRDTVYTRQEADAVASYFNSQYGNYAASVKSDGSFELSARTGQKS